MLKIDTLEFWSFYLKDRKVAKNDRYKKKIVHTAMALVTWMNESKGFFSTIGRR